MLQDFSKIFLFFVFLYLYFRISSLFSIFVAINVLL